MADRGAVAHGDVAPRGGGSRWLRTTLVVLSAAYVAAFLAVALSRLGYPYELEWMGGAFADHVDRVLRGERIYVPPTADFVPFLYTPLYFWTSAGVARLVGEGFVPLRLVSITATLATLWLACFLLRRLTRRWLPAVLACGLYAASYPLVDSWFDTCRADSLFLCLLLGSLTVLLCGRASGSAAAAAALLTLSYLSKQTALLLAPPFAVAAACRDPRRATVFALSFAATCGGAVLVLDHIHDGWFGFYTWTLPRQHEYIEGPLVDFWLTDLRMLWPALGLSVWMALRRWRHGSRREVLGHAAWGLGLLLASLSSRLHVGGAENVLMPAYLAICLCAALALGEALAPETSPRSRGVVLAALCVQLGILVYDPSRFVPTEADRQGGDRVLRVLRETEGPVMLPLHGYLPKLAGKRGAAHAMAVLDVIRGADPKLARDLEEQYWDYGRDRGIELIVLDDNYGEFARLVWPGYRGDGRLFAPGDRSFLPVVGLATRPQMLFRRTK